MDSSGYTVMIGSVVTHPWQSCATQVKLQRRQEQLQTELEQCGEDMDKMAALLDEMEELNKNATDLDMTLLDRNIDKMMPELGFTPEDSDQLVAAYRSADFVAVAVAVAVSADGLWVGGTTKPKWLVVQTSTACGYILQSWCLHGFTICFLADHHRLRPHYW